MSDTVRIFVSHNHRDSEWCRAFVGELRSLGADVWYDEYNLHSGRLFREIEREIKTRPIFIPVLSSDALSSEWVMAECDLALTYQLKLPQERFFLPVQAVTCEVDGFLSTYRRISAPRSGSLQPGVAAKQVGIALSLPLPDDTNAQEVLTVSAEDWCIRGRSLRMQGRAAEALDAFEAALALDPRSIQALVGKGGALEELDLPDRTSEALAAYTSAIEIDRSSAQAFA